jgi:hypothetical protein
MFKSKRKILTTYKGFCNSFCTMQNSAVPAVLAEQYGIHHIRISPYNSQANGIVEHRHLDVREAIMKVCDGEERKWLTATHAVFWAEWITTHKALRHSAY